MKRINSLVLLVGIFLAVGQACNKKEDLSFRKGLVRSVEGSNVPFLFKSAIWAQFKFEFQYDQEGRVTKVGDHVFYYGADGKVQTSRIHLSSGADNYAGEAYIQRLNYHWDGAGRLKEVFLDSLYIRNSVDPDAETISVDGAVFQQLVGDVKIAEFTYTGNSTAPSAIAYRDTIRMNADLIGGMETVIAPPTTIFFEYEGANVTERKGSYIRQSPQWGDREHVNVIYSQYDTDLPHFLYAAYRQLGFHPYKLYDVVPKNLESASVWQPEGGPGPDWSLETNANEHTFDAQGRVTEINFLRIVHHPRFTIRYY